MLSSELASRLQRHLVRIYGEPRAAATTRRLTGLLEAFAPQVHTRPRGGAPFDETDVLLLAYGDQVRDRGEAPLATLSRFLRHHTGSVVTGLHLLPHYPATSDDGFAVADFSAVDAALGEWRDVERLAGEYRLMLDAVVNHTSASHPWCVGWLADDPRYKDFFVEADPSADLSHVVRPRASPLLTRFESAGGPRWVWTTFGPDQVDLNYANPEVLLAVTEQILGYLRHGAGLLRLDAVAFLWKEPGTSCIHLPQTHEIIRLWRTAVDAVAPGTLLVTETNVPHDENLTYFGSGDDEAHAVYQFALPPLTLDAFRRGDARRLAQWAADLKSPSPRTTFLNFLASHDGIGLRPVEGLLSGAEVDALCENAAGHGGRVSYRDSPGRARAAYEINAVYLDALAAPEPEEPSREVDRFEAAHAILLSLVGVPLLYFHSLFGSRNWLDGVDRTGRARTINRQRFDLAEIEEDLADRFSLRRQVLDRLLRRIALRVAQPAFHPNADQAVLDGGASFLAVQRTALGASTVVCVHDVSGRPGRFRARLRGSMAGERMVDLADGTGYDVQPDGTLEIDVAGYGVHWLSPA